MSRFRLASKGVLFLLLAAIALFILSSNAAAASQIYGTVTDVKTDKPIEDAQVYIYQPDSKEKALETRTNARGFFEVDIESGTYTIYVSSEGYSAYKEEVNIEGRFEHNVKLTPGSGGKNDTNKDNYTKDDTTKDDTTKDDTTKDDTTRDDTTKNYTKEESGITNVVMLATVGATTVVAGIIVGFLVGRRKGQKTDKTGTKNGNDWTICPECGTSLQQKNLSSHIDNVHQKSKKSNENKLTEESGKSEVRMKKRGRSIE
jgi:hypothetical protein